MTKKLLEAKVNGEPVTLTLFTPLIINGDHYLVYGLKIGDYSFSQAHGGCGDSCDYCQECSKELGHDFHAILETYDRYSGTTEGESTYLEVYDAMVAAWMDYIHEARAEAHGY